jgi:DNA-binding transcriptional MocR family regulator
MQGWSSIPRWILHSEKIGPHAKLIYVVIQSHTDEHGTAYPSHRTIAEVSGLSRRAVQRGCAELQALGVLEVIHRARKDGGQAANLYRVKTVRPE